MARGVAALDLAGSSAPYSLCQAEEKIGGQVVLGDEATCQYARSSYEFSDRWESVAGWDCTKDVRNMHNSMLYSMCLVDGPVTFENPPIDLGGLPTLHPELTLDFSSADATLVPLAGYTDTVLLDTLAVACPLTTAVRADTPTFLRYTQADGTVATYLNDKRVDLIANTLEQPACPIGVPKTFLNADTCVRRPECTAPVQYSSTAVTLDETTLRAMYCPRPPGAVKRP